MSDRDPVTSLERLRETVALRVQATSLRTVARQVGMSPAVLERFLSGEMPYSRTRQRLQEWWVRQSARPRVDVTVEGVEVAIGALVRDLPPEHRVRAIRRVVSALRRVYAEQASPPPDWLERLVELWTGGIADEFGRARVAIEADEVPEDAGELEDGEAEADAGLEYGDDPWGAGELEEDGEPGPETSPPR